MQLRIPSGLVYYLKTMDCSAFMNRVSTGILLVLILQVTSLKFQLKTTRLNTIGITDCYIQVLLLLPYHCLLMFPYMKLAEQLPMHLLLISILEHLLRLPQMPALTRISDGL